MYEKISSVYVHASQVVTLSIQSICLQYADIMYYPVDNLLESLCEVSSQRKSILIVSIEPNTVISANELIDIQIKYPNTNLVILFLDINKQIIMPFVQAQFQIMLSYYQPTHIIDDALIAAQKNQSFFCPYITKLLADEYLQQNKLSSINEFQQITPREIEILQFIANGDSNKVIAKSLSISAKTVATHREHLLRKLNVRNTAAMINRAYQLRLLLLK